MTSLTIEVLLAARRIANLAQERGVLREAVHARTICQHLGAVLADSVLQAGLSYRTVVRPRVQAILENHPHCDTISALAALVQDGATGAFLNWRHHAKVNRFEEAVFFLQKWGVENVWDLRACLVRSDFRAGMQSVSGIGPKTVDYMACLVGIESIAVDRHVRAFAEAVGVERRDYHFLRASFCCAADLLALPRPTFDGWLWSRAAGPAHRQGRAPSRCRN